MPTPKDQPPPQPNDRTPIVDMVVADLIERKRVGTERYGTPLQAFNGRKALVDLYQELQDAVIYCRQEIEERAAQRDAETERLSGKVKTLRSQLDLAHTELLDEHARALRAERRIAECDRMLAQGVRDVDALRTRAQTAEAERDNLTAEVDELQARLDTATSTRDAYAHDNARLKARVAELELAVFGDPPNTRALLEEMAKSGPYHCSAPDAARNAAMFGKLKAELDAAEAAGITPDSEAGCALHQRACILLSIGIEHSWRAVGTWLVEKEALASEMQGLRTRAETAEARVAELTGPSSAMQNTIEALARTTQERDTLAEKLAHVPVSVENANELQDILCTHSNGGGALIISARELRRLWESTKAENAKLQAVVILAALFVERQRGERGYIFDAALYDKLAAAVAKPGAAEGKDANG